VFGFVKRALDGLLLFSAHTLEEQGFEALEAESVATRKDEGLLSFRIAAAI
jgi:hypothetical protein